MRLGFLLMTAIPLFGLATPSLAAPGGKIKVLIVEGVSNHDWQHRLQLVRKILDKDGSFQIDVSITPSTEGDAAWETWNPDFSKYDVVLSGYNNIWGKPTWPMKVRHSFEQFVKSGGGFYAYHEANNSFAEWPAYNDMIGLGWRDKGFGSAILIRPDESIEVVPPGQGDSTWHPDRSDVLVRQLVKHPIHAGLPPTWMAADIEVYHYTRGPARNVQVISYAIDPKLKLGFPIEWTCRFGKGRVFVSSYGHVWAGDADPVGMRCAAFQTIMIRALKWLAKRNPGRKAPTDFPTSDKVSLRKW